MMGRLHGLDSGRRAEVSQGPVIESVRSGSRGDHRDMQAAQRTHRTRLARSFAALCLGFSGLLTPLSTLAEPTGTEVLREAFRNRYELSFTAELEMRMARRGKKARERVLHVAALHDADSYRALGQLSAPEYLRGMTILSISETGASHQAFVYMPAHEKVRRISITHKDDAFLGSDLTYEDFERRQLEDYEVTGVRTGTGPDEEAIYIVSAKPVAQLNYDRIEYDVAQSDHAILGIREYRDGTPAPSRQMQASRAGMQEVDEHVFATEMRFETPGRDTATEVTFRELRAQRVDDRLFTVSALQRKADLERARRRPSSSSSSP